MNGIQIILILSILLVLAFAWRLLRKRLFIRVFFILHSLLGIVLVLWPDLASRIAGWVGVGRGTDLLVYVMFLLMYIGGFCFVGKCRQIERTQTALLRRLALLEETLEACKSHSKEGKKDEEEEIHVN